MLLIGYLEGIDSQRGIAWRCEDSLSPRRFWTDKPREVQQAVLNNRRRMSRKKGKQPQRLRSEMVERSFAHNCETGGARRTWLRGLEKISKHYLITAAARNLGTLMLKLFGVGKPRSWQGLSRALSALWNAVRRSWRSPPLPIPL